MSKDIHIQKFSLAIHGKVLFADADLHLAYGRKYGLIGPNGSGMFLFDFKLLSLSL
jgi:ATPase subunit of ABC transporter with duplicated ATPase domains